jgi:hypothetical protein
LVKIGYTRRTVEERMRELRGPGVPDPFELIDMVAVRDPVGREREVHSLLQELRHRTDREFFLHREQDEKDAIARAFNLIRVKELSEWQDRFIGAFVENKNVPSAVLLPACYENQNLGSIGSIFKRVCHPRPELSVNNRQDLITMREEYLARRNETRRTLNDEDS